MVRRIALLVAAWAVFAVQADVQYLYWTVDQDHLSEKTEFTFAQLAVWKDNVRVTTPGDEGVYMDLVNPGDVWDSTKSQYPYGGAALVGGTLDSPGTGTKLPGSQIAVILDEWQGAAYSFQLELYNADWDQVGPEHMMVSYESLVYATFEKSGSAGADHTWNAVGPAPVPEPTGGVMMLLGLAVLGLKRKTGCAKEGRGRR